MRLLAEKVPIDRKCAYWKIKRHNCSVFLDVYMAVIHVPMWCINEQLTKSQNVFIGWKCVYWIKMCILSENVPIEKKKRKVTTVQCF